MPAAFDFGDFPALSTSRLELGAFDTRDADDVFAFRGDAEVQQYNSTPHRSLDETLRFIEAAGENYRLRKQILWAVRERESGRVVGSLSLCDWDGHHRRASLGYDLARAQWGRGLAFEAATAGLRFGFAQMALNRIEIWTAAQNVRSMRLAERLGFTQDGIFRKRIIEDDGEFHDCAVFGLLNPLGTGAQQ